MWNWIKFAVLLLLMTITGVLSYSTWIDLVFPPSVATWSENNDKFLLVRASEPNTASHAEFSTVFTSEAAASVGEIPTSVRFTSGDYSHSTAAQRPYIATSGKMTDALRACSASTEPYGSDKAPQEVPVYKLPRPVQDVIPRPLQAAGNFAVFDGYNVGCTFPVEFFWTQRGSRYTFTLPKTLTVTFRPSEAASPSWGSSGAPSNNPDVGKSNCVIADVAYGAGTTLDSVYPQPNLDNQMGWGSGLPVPTWAACTDSALGTHGTDGVDQEPINVALTDVIEKDGEARSLFFAGAAVAILGALLIEATKVSIDLLEARVEKKKRSTGIQDDGTPHGSTPDDGSPSAPEATSD